VLFLIYSEFFQPFPKDDPADAEVFCRKGAVDLIEGQRRLQIVPVCMLSVPFDFFPEKTYSGSSVISMVSSLEVIAPCSSALIN
jgi:hypothetical protein